MSDDIPDWDPRWDKPDPRITTLKNKIDKLDDRINNLRGEPAIGPVINDIEDLKDQIAELLLYHKIRLLHEMEKIDKAEMIRIYTMLHSEDPENRKLAIEVIDKIK